MSPDVAYYPLLWAKTHCRPSETPGFQMGTEPTWGESFKPQGRSGVGPLVAEPWLV